MPARIAKRVIKSRLGERIVNSIFSRIEGKPVFRVMENGQSIDAHAARIRNPSKYAGLFKKGEKVLLIHFNITDKAAGERALVELANKFPELKTQGFSGIYGDSQNPVVLRQFEQLAKSQQLAFAYLHTPFFGAIGANSRYSQNVRENKYPQRYLKEKPRRLVIRFPD